MKMFYKVLSLAAMLMVLNLSLSAQVFEDPQSMDAKVSPAAITVDGALTESVWSDPNLEYLQFGPVAVVPSLGHTVTGEAIVKPPYTDVSYAKMYFLHNGLDLYIGLRSDDKSVCRFGDSWEGDGIFMKVKTFAGEDKEIKLYYNLSGVNPAVNFETNLPAGSVTGASAKGSNTVVNDTTQVDNGYTMEMVIHLDQLGFTSVPEFVQVLINLFDPDGYTGSNPPYGPIGAYYKCWWGSEWGPAMRKINMSSVTLPVELTSFAAISNGSSVELNWSTATEKNNRGFEIQKSADGTNYMVIGFVNGNGTTTEQNAYSFVDNNNNTGKYYYRLKQLDFDGSYNLSDVVAVEVTAPVEFALNQNYPNPFNPSTTLQFSIPEQSHVVVKVFDMLGKEVATIVNDNLAAGLHQQVFNATNFASGNYVYQLNVVTVSGKTLNTAKIMTLMK